MQPGERVMVVSHTERENDGTVVVHTYGEGTYDGDLPCPGLWYRKNPRITLDSGETVWGAECWWGPVERTKKEHLAMSREGKVRYEAVSITAERAECKAPNPGDHRTEADVHEMVAVALTALIGTLHAAEQAGNTHAGKYHDILAGFQRGAGLTLAERSDADKDAFIRGVLKTEPTAP